LDLVGGVGRFFPFCRFEGLDASMRPRFASPANLLDADTLGNLGANGGSARPAIADFTGDGHPDILAGHSLGLDFFVNQGDAAPGTPATFANLGQATPLDLAGGGRISVEFVAPAARDFDGDTLADLLAAAGDTVYYFHHQGTFDPDGFPEFADGVAVIGPAAQAEISGIALGDFDGDGKVDAVTASSAPPVYVFHQGVDAAPSFEAGVAFEPGDAIFDRGGASVVATGDIVGDDSEDLVVTADDATFEIYETTGVGDAPSLSGPTPLSLQVMGADARGRPIFLDLDGDANVDILFAEAGTGPGDAGPRILSFEQTTTAPPGFTFVDYLTDGGTIQVPGSHLHLAAGDVTGDGALDLVAITEGDAFALQVWILAHEDGAGLDPFRDAWAAPVAAEVLGASQDVLAHALADPDFDGDLDIVGWSRRGGLHLMLNIGTPTAPRFTRPIRFLPPSGDLPNRGGGGGLAALDLGGDGDLDWLIGQGDGGLVLWRSV
ncbi:MAG: VCBS repeat-containing protein, partial [Myxococcales bacterium]|nr:VCBS repeat-containing protein [Myxococcales bacterium]